LLKKHFIQVRRLTSFSGKTQSYHEAPKTLFRSKSLLLLFMLPGSLFICIHFMEIQSYFDFFYMLSSCDARPLHKIIFLSGKEIPFTTRWHANIITALDLCLLLSLISLQSPLSCTPPFAFFPASAPPSHQSSFMTFMSSSHCTENDDFFFLMASPVYF